jgi:hypothetical protein
MDRTVTFIYEKKTERKKKLGLDTKTGRLTDRQSQCDLDLESLDSRVEAGSNISTVTLRVVGGDEKGSLKFESVKYGRESQGTRTRERLRWQEPAAYTKDRPVLSSPLVREGAPEEQDRNYQTGTNIVLDTKTYCLTGRQSPCDYDFDLESLEMVFEDYWEERTTS